MQTELNYNTSSAPCVDGRATDDEHLEYHASDIRSAWGIRRMRDVVPITSPRANVDDERLARLFLICVYFFAV